MGSNHLKISGDEILPDNKLIAIASDDGYTLGILSSISHVWWSLVTGSWLGVGNDSVYVKSRCFESFPFPALEEGPLKQRIRDLGERLDAHRKRQQTLHPDLTLTGMYNVLEAVRADTPLTAKEKAIHDKGLISILRQIHDELDAAVLEAYGWQDCSGDHRSPRVDGSSEQDSRRPVIAATLLTRLVALNHARAAEEKTASSAGSARTIKIREDRARATVHHNREVSQEPKPPKLPSPPPSQPASGRAPSLSAWVP